MQLPEGLHFIRLHTIIGTYPFIEPIFSICVDIFAYGKPFVPALKSLSTPTVCFAPQGVLLESHSFPPHGDKYVQAKKKTTV